jgi:hypothetical protein
MKTSGGMAVWLLAKESLVPSGVLMKTVLKINSDYGN